MCVSPVSSGSALGHLGACCKQVALACLAHRHSAFAGSPNSSIQTLCPTDTPVRNLPWTSACQLVQLGVCEYTWTPLFLQIHFLCTYFLKFCIVPQNPLKYPKFAFFACFPPLVSYKVHIRCVQICTSIFSTAHCLVTGDF